MTVYELIEKIGGEIVRGKARVRRGTDYVIVGQLNGDNMEYTEAGRLLATGYTAPDEDKPKRGRPAKAASVESAEDAKEVTNTEAQGLT